MQTKRVKIISGVLIGQESVMDASAADNLIRRGEAIDLDKKVHGPSVMDKINAANEAKAKTDALREQRLQASKAEDEAARLRLDAKVKLAVEEKNKAAAEMQNKATAGAQ